MLKILIAEDEEPISNLIRMNLTRAGYQCVCALDGKKAADLMMEEHFDLVLLDIMLPGEDGISILKKLRSNSATANIPIILCTAKGTEYDKVIGLDFGADDYLVKPFGMMEMISRIKALLRRTSPQKEVRKLHVGELEINLCEHTVTAGGTRIQLTLKEYELLRLFMENTGRVFTRDELLSKIWDADYIGETRTVDVHIGTLRTKLGAYGNYIETVRGVGYRIEKNI